LVGGLDGAGGLGNQMPTFVRHLSNNEIAIGYFNFNDFEAMCKCVFADAGLPYASGYGLEMVNLFTGENIGVQKDYYNLLVAPHDCALFKARLVKL
jgi:alpha-galactosidase